MLCCGSSWPGARITVSAGVSPVPTQELALPFAAAVASQLAPLEPGDFSPLTG